jgi:hypothetical protein
LVFPCHALECSAIHLAASCSVMKPLITSVSPSGHKISTPQPDPGFFRATKVGRCSDILRLCACGGPVQASYPATIKLTHYPGAGSGSLSKLTPKENAWLAALAPDGKLRLHLLRGGAAHWVPRAGLGNLSVTSFSQRRVRSPYRSPNRRNHKRQTMRGPRPRKSGN